MNTTPQLYPLSHPELRIYLVQALDPASSMWNLSYGLKIDEEIDLPVFQTAVNDICEAFEGLRLRFTEINGEVRKYLAPPSMVPIQELDFTTSGGEPTFDRWAKAEAGKPIWSLDAPLFQVATARLSESTSAWFLKIHHIIADGTAAAVWFNRLMERYCECKYGDAPAEHPPARSVLEFLDVEHAYLESDKAQEDKTYWLSQFETLPDSIDVLAESLEESTATSRTVFRLPEDVAKRVYAMCETHHTSPYRVVLAAQYTFWSRFGRTSDLVIGIPVGNRTEKGFEDSIGMFVSTIPLRLSFPMDLSFGEAVEHIGKQIKDIRRVERYPFDILIHDLREKFGETPNLINIMTAQFMRCSHPGIRSMEFYCQRSTNEPITTYVSHGSKGENHVPIEFFTDYQTAVFTEHRIDALHDHLCNIIRDGVEHPGKTLGELNMLSAEERNHVISGFNNRTAKAPRDKTLVDLFAAQVERTPDNTAVVFQDQSLTYHQLSLRATRLADHLRRRGVQPGTVVALLVDRSMMMIIGALGIMKAGAAYAPIDPSYPPDRVHYMLKDSETPLVVTMGHYQAQFGIEQEVLNLDEPGFFDGPVQPLANACTPEDLAIVIYTSGSTGHPKGVMLEQRAIVNFVSHFIRERHLTEADRISKHASFSFDSSLLETYPTLSVGATLYIIPDDIRLNLFALNAYFEEQGITGAFFTTQLGEQFNSMIDNHSLRFLDVGGEKLRSFTQRRYQLYNGYGPTECSVYTTDFPVDGNYRNIPIGKPLNNYQVYVLDPHNQPVPIGAPGELCVGGPSLARGYKNLPEKTAAAFVANPFVPGQRMYRTGDLARWLPDGNLEHLGRIDRQVKLRGFKTPTSAAAPLKSKFLSLIIPPAISTTPPVCPPRRSARTRLNLCSRRP